MNIKDRVTGKYHGVEFNGYISYIEPNFEIGSRGAINILVELDKEIQTPSNEKRNQIFLQGLNPTTNLKYNESLYGYHSFEVRKI